MTQPQKQWYELKDAHPLDATILVYAPGAATKEFIGVVNAATRADAERIVADVNKHAHPNKVVLTVFDDAEGWLRTNLQYMSLDRLAVVIPMNGVDLDGMTAYRDRETAQTHYRDKHAHVRALNTLCETIGRTLHVGSIKNPFHLTNAVNWDVTVWDAYFQLVVYGQVLYG